MLKSCVPSQVFWDVVVLTASDEAQKEAFNKQLEEKLSNNLLPKVCEYLVVSDPIGVKIGCGGATMHALYQLHCKYSDKLNSKRIFLINTGGLSKRMPNCSILGKIFMAVPYQDTERKVCTLLDLKLALSLPFIYIMPPGVYQTSSDTLELFTLYSGEGESSYKNNLNGFTAIAHPSSLIIGSTHGVFVPTEEKTVNKYDFEPVELLKCKEVLQKPTIEYMKEKRAIIKMKKCVITAEFVYTDSVYFFDHIISQKLIKLFEENNPLNCEINGYEWFMKSICNPDIFLQDFSNNTQLSFGLKYMLGKVIEELRDQKFNVMVLNHSQFFHLGTMKEYLENFNPHSLLGYLLNWGNSLMNASLTTLKIDTTSVCISNYFSKESIIERNSVVEFCTFDCKAVVQSNCIVSHCHCEGDLLTVPSNTFLHTVPVRCPSLASSFVTLIFDINADLKKKHKSMKSFIEENKNFYKNLSDDISFKDQEFSLWNAQIFALAASKQVSLKQSFNLVEPSQASPDCKLISACEVMLHKDLNQFLLYRKTLTNKLLNN